MVHTPPGRRRAARLLWPGTTDLLPASSLASNEARAYNGFAPIRGVRALGRIDIRALEQPELQHAGGVEAVDSQGRSGRGGGSSARHQADQLRAGRLGPASGRFSLDR